MRYGFPADPERQKRHSCGFRSSTWQLHPEYAEPGLLLWRIHCGRDAETQNHPCVQRIDDAVVPQPGGAVISAALLCVLVERGFHEFLLLGVCHRFTLTFELIHFDLQKNVRCLLATHDRDPRIRPHPKLARSVRPSAHSIVSSTIRTP